MSNEATGWLIIAAVWLIYFAPAINATRWNRERLAPIFWLNLFAGWTVVGWVAAFVWSCCPPRKMVVQHLDEHGGLAARHVA